MTIIVLVHGMPGQPLRFLHAWVDEGPDMFVVRSIPTPGIVHGTFRRDACSWYTEPAEILGAPAIASPPTLDALSKTPPPFILPTIRFDKHVIALAHEWNDVGPGLDYGVVMMDVDGAINIGPHPVCLNNAYPGPCRCGRFLLQPIADREWTGR